MSASFTAAEHFTCHSLIIPAPIDVTWYSSVKHTKGAVPSMTGHLLFDSLISSLSTIHNAVGIEFQCLQDLNQLAEGALCCGEQRQSPAACCDGDSQQAALRTGQATDRDLDLGACRARKYGLWS